MDVDYFRKSTRLSIAEETKIRATKEEADAFFASPPTNSTAVNFISDVFFLTCAFQHVGLGKTVNNRSDLEKRLGELEKEVQRIEADPSWRNVSARGNVSRPAEYLADLDPPSTRQTPAQPQGEAAIKKLKVRRLRPCACSAND